MEKKPPLREVVQVGKYRSKYAPFGSVSFNLLLDCGHTHATKSAAYHGRPPKQVHCRQCRWE
jgi:hypothetical protein